MTCLLLPAYVKLPFYDLAVGSGGVVVGLYGLFGYWLVCHRQIDDLLALMTSCCPVVGGFTMIVKFQSISINHVF
jgi:hypothetical protein